MVEDMKVREGYKRTEVGVIPEDWQAVSLNEIIDYTKGYAFKSSEYKENGVRIIRVSDTDYDSIKNSDPIYIDENDYKKYENWGLKEDDLILSTVGSKPPMYNSMVGKIVKVDIMNSGSLLNQNAVKLSARNQNKCTQLLIFNNLKTKNYLSYIEKIFRGNANQASITLKELFKYQIPLPKDLNEQKAIAKVLTDTDNLIHSIQNLIDKKEKIKKGTMQELLTGKKRLDGFSGEWEAKKIGDICVVLRGKIITEANSVDGDIPVIAGGMQPSYYHNVPNRTGKTITISGSGANAGYIGFHDIPIYASDCLTISEQDNRYDIEFIYYRLMLIQEKIYYMQIGGAQPHIYPKDIEPIEIRLPPIAEQKAIAQILSHMDKEIETLKEKLEKYKKVKKGMMQELLTGRIRLI